VIILILHNVLYLLWCLDLGEMYVLKYVPIHFRTHYEYIVAIPTRNLHESALIANWGVFLVLTDNTGPALLLLNILKDLFVVIVALVHNVDLLAVLLGVLVPVVRRTHYYFVLHLLSRKHYYPLLLDVLCGMGVHALYSE
jgi:hypothetical protein